MPVDISVGLGLAKTVTGLVNNGKAKEEAATLARTRPKLGRDTIADNNLALTESDLGNNGLDAKSKQAYEDLNNGQFSNSIDSILKSGGGANSISELYGNNQEGRMKLASLNTDLRLKQIQNVIDASKPVEARDKEQFAYNIDAPWKDAAQANAAARQGAQSEIWNGIDTVGGALTGAAQNAHEDKMFSKYFGLGTPTVTPQPAQPTLTTNEPTYNVAQPNPTSFSGNVGNPLLWSNTTDINANGSYVPTAPNPPQNNGQPVNISNPNNYGFFNTMMRI